MRRWGTGGAGRRHTICFLFYLALQFISHTHTTHPPHPDPPTDTRRRPPRRTPQFYVAYTSLRASGHGAHARRLLPPARGAGLLRVDRDHVVDAHDRDGGLGRETDLL